MKRACSVRSMMVLALAALPAFAGSLEEDLELMTTWFAGRFDNHQQVWLEKGADTDPELIHERIHSIFAPVDLPAFGDRVFYVQQYMDGDPDKIYRQRIYTFSIDDRERAIVLKIFAPLDAKAVKDAHRDPAKLAGLTPETVRATPGCEVFWKREGDHFKGSMKEGACRIKSRRSGKELIISDDLYLDEDEIWIKDRAVDVEGNYVFGHKGDVSHKLLKVREFTGWAALKKEDGSWSAMRGIEIHDQGQRLLLRDKDGQSMGYEIELAQLLYMGKTPILKLGVYEEGAEKTKMYTWANPEAERIGVNLSQLGTLQVGLTLKKDPAPAQRAKK